jgi:hypothetical protein
LLLVHTLRKPLLGFHDHSQVSGLLLDLSPDSGLEVRCLGGQLEEVVGCDVSKADWSAFSWS